VFEVKFKSDETLPSRSFSMVDREGERCGLNRSAVPLSNPAAASPRLARWWLLFAPGVAPGDDSIVSDRQDRWLVPLFRS